MRSGERAAVTVAGPLANFILAGFVYFYLALVGTTQLSSYIGDVAPKPCRRGWINFG